MTNILTYVAATVATLPLHSSRNGAETNPRQLAGIGLFIAERDELGLWRFARRASAIDAGESERSLLEWAANRLPAKATLIGWNVDRAFVPRLLDAASSAEPAIACRFVARLTPLLQGGVVDMALDHGGAGARPLDMIAGEMAIYAPAKDDGLTYTAEPSGRVDQLRHDLAAEALAIWRVFIRTAGLVGIEAEAETDAWVARRSRLHVADRADSEVR